jgi:hypothetical protein
MYNLLKEDPCEPTQFCARIRLPYIRPLTHRQHFPLQIRPSLQHLDEGTGSDVGSVHMPEFRGRGSFRIAL